MYGFQNIGMHCSISGEQLLVQGRLDHGCLWRNSNGLDSFTTTRLPVTLTR